MSDNCKKCGHELIGGWHLDGQGNKICASCKVSILVDVCESLAYELVNTRYPYLTEQAKRDEASQIFEDHYLSG